MESNHYVYMLLCGDSTLYTGYTTNITRRLTMHENGTGAKYTRGRGPFELVYLECCPTHSEALKREYAIKQLPRPKKEDLIKEQRGETSANTNELRTK